MVCYLIQICFLGIIAGQTFFFFQLDTRLEKAIPKVTIGD